MSEVTPVYGTVINNKSCFPLICCFFPQYWLQPSASALARLEEIQSSVTSMQPASTIDVQAVWCPASSTPPPPPDPASPEGIDPTGLPPPANGHVRRSARPRSARVQASPYTDLEIKPPLSTLTTQETAW